MVLLNNLAHMITSHVKLRYISFNYYYIIISCHDRLLVKAAKKLR